MERCQDIIPGYSDLECYLRSVCKQFKGVLIHIGEHEGENGCLHLPRIDGGVEFLPTTITHSSVFLSDLAFLP